MEDFSKKLDAKEEARFDDVALHVARTMAQLSIKCRGKEGMLANALCDSLGSYVAMVAVEPPKALEAICKRLMATPWEEIKATHFGYSKLGWQEATAQSLGPKGVGNVVRMGGDPRIKG